MTAHVKNPGDKRFLLLFLILLLDLIVYPFVGERGTVYQWYRLLGLFVTFLCVYAVSFGRSTLIAAILLAIPVALHRVILPLDLSPSVLSMLGLIVSMIFDFFIIVVIFRRIFRLQPITSQTIFGALAVYILVGFVFARVYLLLASLRPAAFFVDPVINGHTGATSTDLIFYSFVTMTSLGASSIIPKTDVAKSLTMIESIVGVLYLAVLVSRLVGMYSSREANTYTKSD